MSLPLIQTGGGSSGVATFSTAGLGYIVLPTFSGGGSGTQTFSPTNPNRVFFSQFVIPFSLTVRKITISISTLFSGGNAMVGIYDSSGNKLFESGGISTTTTGTKTVTITDVVLSPGVYYCATSADNVTAVAVARIYTSPDVTFMPVNGKRVGTAQNSSTGTTMPATLGTLTNTAAFNVPYVFLEP